MLQVYFVVLVAPDILDLLGSLRNLILGKLELLNAGFNVLLVTCIQSPDFGHYDIGWMQRSQVNAFHLLDCDAPFQIVVGQYLAEDHSVSPAIDLEAMRYAVQCLLEDAIAIAGDCEIDIYRRCFGIEQRKRRTANCDQGDCSPKLLVDFLQKIEQRALLSNGIV